MIFQIYVLFVRVVCVLCVQFSLLEENIVVRLSGLAG